MLFFVVPPEVSPNRERLTTGYTTVYLIGTGMNRLVVGNEFTFHVEADAAVFSTTFKLLLLKLLDILSLPLPTASGMSFGFVEE